MNGPLKYHGGKHYLAPQIVALMPPHLHYVEPYFGGGAVLFAKPHDGTSEVINDSNGDLTNFWRVLQDKKAFAEFQRRVEATPFSQREWQQAKEFFILCRQSLAGRCKDFAPITRTILDRSIRVYPEVPLDDAVLVRDAAIHVGRRAIKGQRYRAVADGAGNGEFKGNPQGDSLLSPELEKDVSHIGVKKVAHSDDVEAIETLLLQVIVEPAEKAKIGFHRGLGDVRVIGHAGEPI
jgi:hypothetical protein